MAAPVPPDMSGMLPDMQQRSDHPSGTRSHELEHQVSRRHSGARSHESERQTGRRRWRGGSPQPRIASQAWTAYQDLRQDVDAVAKAKAFEDAPPRKRKRVAACCGVSGLTLAAALFSVLFFFFALQRTGLWSLGRRTGDHDVLSIQDIKRGIIDWAMHWQVGHRHAATLCDGGCNPKYRDCYPMPPGGPRYVRLVARSGLRRALARR